MRISHHHHTTLAYCRELSVATEVFVPDCESAYLAQTRGPLAGRRIRMREARADFDGYIAELLNKSLSLSQLDQTMTSQDRDRVLAYLRGLGALDERGQYRGSSRRGESAPVAMRELFEGIPSFYVQTDWSSQPTMMQVVGGMGSPPGGARLARWQSHHLSCERARDPAKRTRRVGDLLRREWAVTARRRGLLRDHDPTASVERHRERSLTTGAVGDRGNAIRRSRQNRPPVQAAILGRRRCDLRRTILDGPERVGQIIYPSHGLTTNKGVLVGYYLDFRGTMRARPPAENRTPCARARRTRVHPQYPAEFETAFSVSWARVPWSRGSWQ